MSNKTLAQIIQNNIRVKNLEGSRDIVIYDNESGAANVSDIALEIGETYEIFLTSAIDGGTGAQYGQQKITIKLIPAELALNVYALFNTVNYFDVLVTTNNTAYINISKNDTELWSVSSSVQLIKIYKIIKKAV